MSQTENLPEHLKHHPFGPSSLGRLYKCPASHRLSKDEPPTSSPDAAEGTLMHRAFEQYWRGGMDWRAELDDGQAELVGIANDFARTLMTRYDKNRWFEHRVELLNDSGSVVNFGTADMVIKTPQKHIVIDLKFGRKIDDDALVLQLASYLAALACGNDPETENNVSYEAWAFFPRLGKELKFEHPGPAQNLVNAVVEQIEAIKAQAADDTLEPTPGEHCDYCRHLANCEGVRKLTTDGFLAPMQTMEAESAENAPIEASSLLARAGEVHKLYDLAALAEKQAKALRGRIRDILMQQPDALPGLQLKKVRGKRRTEDLMRLFIRLVPDHLSKSEWDAIVKQQVSPVDAEDAYLKKKYQGRGTGKPTLKELKEQFAEIVGNAIKAPDERRIKRIDG